MQDRRMPSEMTTFLGHSRWKERRIRLLERRKHNNIYRIIHIDVREVWGFLVSRLRRSN